MYHILLCIVGVVGLVWALRVIAGSLERLNARLEELSKLLQQFNDKVDVIARKTGDIDQIIGQGARSKDMGSPEAEVAHSNHYKGHSSEGNTQTRNRIPGNADRTTGSKDSQINMKEENRPASPCEGKSDASLVAEAEDSVRMLNAHVDQASCAIADLVCHRESPISSKESEDVLNELCCIEPLSCNKLRSKLSTEHASDRLMITRIVLQSGLINACSHIINNGSPPSDGTTLSRTHSDTAEKGQTVADTSQNECCEIYRKYLARIELKLITAMGGSLESGGALLPRHSDVFDETVKATLMLYKSVSEAATSMDLVTYTIPPSTDFDHSQMENTEEGGNETASDIVICTVDMGLRCRKRNESSSEEEWEVANKAKVVLASTLDA